MSEHLRLSEVETPFDDRLQVEGAYEARQRVRDDLEWDVLLEQSAAGAAEMPRRLEPAPEALDPERQRAFEESAKEPAGRKVLDRVFRTFTGQSLEAIEEAVRTGTLGHTVSLRLLDPVGNVAEEMIREQGALASVEAGE